MKTLDSLTSGVIDIVSSLVADPRIEVSSGTKILSDLDFDSLKMIELIDNLKQVYGIDFYAPPLTIEDLYSVQTIVGALRANGVREIKAKGDADVLEGVF